MKPLANYKYELFCNELVACNKPREAAIRAGYSEKTASHMAMMLMKKPEVVARVKYLRKQVLKRVKIEAADVVAHWWNIVTHDPNELSQNRVGCCRYCYGIGNNFQWKTQREFDAAVAAALLKHNLKEGDYEPADPRIPRDIGGFGYDVRMAPSQSCPECNGLGELYQVFPDSTKLSAQARAAYEGVKLTRNGLEIKTASRERALENMAKHLGMFVEKHEIEAGEAIKAFLSSISGGRAPIKGND